MRKAGAAPPHGATPASSVSGQGLGELEAFTPTLTATNRFCRSVMRILTSSADVKVKTALKLGKRPINIPDSTSRFSYDPCFFLSDPETQDCQQYQVPNQAAQRRQLILPEHHHLGEEDRDQDGSLEPAICRYA